MCRIYVSILSLIVASFSWANEPSNEQRWLDRKSEGWFWYKSQPESENMDKEELRKEPASFSSQTYDPPKMTENLIDNGPSPLSAAWIRENLQSYLDAATDNPTPENVAAFLYIQRYAMDKSFAFMDATQDVVTGNPNLDEINRRPLATYANRKLDEVATNNHRSLLNDISQSAGLFVFLDESEASAAQLNVVEMLERNTPFSTIKISSSPTSMPMLGTLPDNGHSIQMGIKSYPAVALVRADGTFDIISQGPVSLPDLSKRILLGAKRLEIISDTEYNSTRPVKVIENSIRDFPASKATNNKNAPPVPASEIVKAFSGNNYE